MSTITVLAMSLAARSVPFAAKPMRQIRRSDVEVWIKSMDAAGLAPGTIKTRYVNVRSVFRAAVRDRIIGRDPTDTVRLPRRRRADAAMSIPTPEDVGLLMTFAEDGFRTFIALCAFAGLRLGEAAAVQLGDLEFVGTSLTVARQVQRVNGGAIDVRADRSVSCTSPTCWAISSPSTSQTTARSATNSGCSPAKVTSRPTKTLSSWWRKTLRTAGLSGIKLHDLRHFYASGLIAAGDVVTVQRSLGHAKATTTLNTYAHLWPTAEDRTRKAAQSIMDASLGELNATGSGTDA